MKCTNKRRGTTCSSYRNPRLRRRRKIQLLTRIALFLVIVVVIGAIGFFLNTRSHIKNYETKHYTKPLYVSHLFAEDLSVLNENVSYTKFVTDDSFFAISLLNLEDQSFLLAENIHDKVYPASITKLLTMHLALKYSNLEDIVTISKNATNLPSGSSRAWLKENDRMTMEDLLYSMMLASGNDSAIAIAEHVSGSEEAFVELMNKEVQEMGATNSHFTNAHGYHDDNHYTTVYDIYLIMNKCLQNQVFLDIISCETYNTAITEPDGYQRKVSWTQSNMFLSGIYQAPDGVTILGGKTGTTDEAKACLVIYCKDDAGVPYLATIMGAETKSILYNNMTALLATLSN